LSLLELGSELLEQHVSTQRKRKRSKRKGAEKGFKKEEEEENAVLDLTQAAMIASPSMSTFALFGLELLLLLLAVPPFSHPYSPPSVIFSFLLPSVISFFLCVCLPTLPSI
jgi:hypothetical protein